jgi:hypothetical protein
MAEAPVLLATEAVVDGGDLQVGERQLETQISSALFKSSTRHWHVELQMAWYDYGI